MKSVPLDLLAERIIRPGIEKHLVPLLAYRGNVTLGRAHRCWNLLISMKEHEATISDATQRLMMNGDYSQICLPERPMQHMGLYSFISRLKMNPNVADLEPGLREFLDYILPGRGFGLTPVSPVSRRSRHKGAGGWRQLILLPRGRAPIAAPEGFDTWARGKSCAEAMDRFGHSYPVVHRWFEDSGVSPRHGGFLSVPGDFPSWAKGKSVQQALDQYKHSAQIVRRWFAECGIEPEASDRHTPALCYPFLIHDRGRDEHALVREVNAAVPKYLSPDARADICQDLLVGILCGDFPRDDLQLPAREMMRRVARMFPTKLGPMSLDAPLGDEGDFSLLDTLADDADRRWDMA